MSDALPPFQRFLDTHREEVWRFLVACVGRSDAEDCFQETFMSALRAYPRLRADSNLRAWVLTIAHRKALDSHRGRTRRALPVAEIAAADATSGPSRRAVVKGNAPERGGRQSRFSASASGPEVGEMVDTALWEAVRELPARQRHAVVLRYMADLTHRDIAAAIGCSEVAARRSLHEGLTKLRKVVIV